MPAAIRARGSSAASTAPTSDVGVHGTAPARQQAALPQPGIGRRLEQRVCTNAVVQLVRICVDQPCLGWAARDGQGKAGRSRRDQPLAGVQHEQPASRRALPCRGVRTGNDDTRRAAPLRLQAGKACRHERLGRGQPVLRGSDHHLQLREPGDRRHECPANRVVPALVEPAPNIVRRRLACSCGCLSQFAAYAAGQPRPVATNAAWQLAPAERHQPGGRHRTAEHTKPHDGRRRAGLSLANHGQRQTAGIAGDVQEQRAGGATPLAEECLADHLPARLVERRHTNPPSTRPVQARRHPAPLACRTRRQASRETPWLAGGQSSERAGGRRQRDLRAVHHRPMTRRRTLPSEAPVTTGTPPACPSSHPNRLRPKRSRELRVESSHRHHRRRAGRPFLCHAARQGGR